MQDTIAFLLMLVHGVGLLAIIAILFGVLQRRRFSHGRQALLLGLLFATAGLLVMLRPVQIVPGAFVDLRGLVVGLAGAFGGWPAALMTALVTIAYRIHLGGHYIAGGISILIAAGAGLLWRRGMRARRAPGSRHFILLGLMIAAHSVSTLVAAATWANGPLIAVLTTLTFASLVGSLAFGKMIQREMRLIASERMLADEALQDPLTGLWNRRGFERQYIEARAQDLDAPLSLLLIDIDFFKRVNDTFGHGVGDRVLEATAATLLGALRPLDQASRHGGEEFAVLLPRTNSGDARKVAEGLRRAVAAMSIDMPEGPSVQITVSIGVSVCGDGCSSLKLLFETADAQLYRAKTGGRNRVESQPTADAPLPGSASGSVSSAIGEPRRFAASVR